MAAMTRRGFGALSAGAIWAAAGLSRGARADGGRHAPPEWAPQERVVMAFSDTEELYGRAAVARIRREQAAIARAIRRFAPVTMLINPEQRDLAARLCGPEVDLVEMPHYDVWTRDVLPTVVIEDGARKAVNWNFNVWGEKFPEFHEDGYDWDRALASAYAAHAGFPEIDSGIVGEGGAIEWDDSGLLLTTETCLLDPDRNPGLGKDEIAAALSAATGAREVVWLWGSEADAVTNGHVDGIAKFLAPGKLVVEVTDDPSDPEYRDLRENARRLRALAEGGALELHEVKRPRWDVIGARGDDFSASYVNCLLVNGGLIMAAFGDAERDRAAAELFAALSGAEVVALRVDEIQEGGGGIHCNTQQIPAL